LAHSFAEWSVAKNAYVASRSGWFSCRSACYLALGVPTIVQDTGFDIAVPSGHGVLKFSDLTEAAACTDEVLAYPDRHAHAAIELACEYFDSDCILTNLLENTFSADNDRSVSNDH
jgi:hypothetical protein